jgi:hypothetical protein
MRLSKTVIIKMTRKDAEELGLLICKCGHPRNNHFDFDEKPCAHCPCKYFHEISRRGIIIKSRSKK